MATLMKRSVLNLLSNIKSTQFNDFNQRKTMVQWRCLRRTATTRVNSIHNSRCRGLYTSNQLNRIVAFKLSDIGEGIREVAIKEWFVSVGDRVSQFDNICEVQSDKAAVTITSRYDGVVTKLYGDVDDVLLVGNPLVDIDVPEEAANDKDPTIGSFSPARQDYREVTASKAKILTTPSVRRIASQFSLDLNAVKATGKNGRVLKEDVLNHLNITSDESYSQDSATCVQAHSLPAESSSQTVVVGSSGQDLLVPVSGFAKAMVKTMTESLKIPHFVLSDEYDVSELVKVRAALKASAAATRGVKLTYMPFILKATSLALQQFPILNSSLDTQCENITYKAAHNIGVAMNTPNGLVVPVIKNVQDKSILDIGTELNKLQDLGSQGKLGLADVSGGTFTISNIGSVGGTYTKPVILAPQVSIGAFGKIQMLPRFDKSGAVRAEHILNVSWSADHRIVDGVTVAKFSNIIRNYLQQPSNLILDL